MTKNVANISNNPPNVKKGKLHFDSETYGKSLNTVQKSSLKALEFLAEALDNSSHL